jgi:hypothetical protein
MKAIQPETQISPAAIAMHSGSHRPGRAPSDGDQRQRLLGRASDLHNDARNAAERGELAAAARSILEALDCERRAGSLGPQVLQLIKPR